MTSTHISPEEQTRAEPAETDEPMSSPQDDDEPTESFSKDELFHLLQNERRRMVLEYLRGTEGPVRMRDVAEQVAAWEHDTDVQNLTSTQRQRVYIPLYQSHLSKLDEAGIIDYQKNRGIVERKPAADYVDQYLQVEPAENTTSTSPSVGTGWDDYYLGATALCYLVLLGAVFELPFVSLLSGIGLSALILLLFTVLTVRRFIE
ncbi:DUF7344 domain-containing protein [Natronosalvus vescus]|uniref:DUF7344 domain-containing protein n=1 Tax=Natronosalvus vescus TaxID=2953881 RepID=UPI0020910E26|nr:hypothetical protein [Natronosalvus vescus]